MIGKATHRHSTEQKLQELHFYGFLNDKEEAWIRAALANENATVAISLPDGKNLTVSITLCKKIEPVPGA